MMLRTASSSAARMPLVERMAAIAAAAHRDGDSSVFTAYCRQLRGPVLRQFCAAYYRRLHGEQQ